MTIPNGFVTIIRAPAREPRQITFGIGARPDDASKKEVEKPQIQPEMPEAVAEVQEVLTAAEIVDDSESIHDEIIQPSKRKRGRPKKERTHE